MPIANDPYIDEKTKENPYKYNRFDSYKFENSDRGRAYIKKNTPKEHIYSEWKPTGYDYAQTNLGSLNDAVFDSAAEQILNIYAQNGAGNNASNEYDFVLDNIMAVALGKDYREIARNHDYYSMMFTGTKMESKSLLEAISKNWETDKVNRKIAGLQNQLDSQDDEEAKKVLESKIEKLEKDIVKLGDYTDRGWLGNTLVASSPVLRQVLKAVAITAGGFGAGKLLGAASVLSQGRGLSAKAISTALKGTTAVKYGNIGRKVGVASNMLDTYLTESGSISRELYNITDENGNKIPDDVRKTTKFVYGLIATAVEYFTPEPTLDRFIKGKTGSKLVKTSFMKYIDSKFLLNYSLKNLKGGASESFEEMLQSGINSISLDIAKKYSDSTGVTKFGNTPVSEILSNAWTNGIEAFRQAFGPSIIAGAPFNLVSSINSTAKAKENIKTYLDESDKDISSLKASAEQFQTFDSNTTIIDIDNLYHKPEKYSKDYSSPSQDGTPAEKLGAIDIMPDPNVDNQYIGVTEEDNDKIKYLLDKGAEGVAVRVHSDALYNSLDNTSFKTLVENYSGYVTDDEIHFNSEETINSFLFENQEIIKQNQNGTISFLSDNGNVSTMILKNDSNSESTINMSDKARKISGDIMRATEGINVSQEEANLLGEFLSSIKGLNTDEAIKNLIVKDSDVDINLREKGAKGATDLSGLKIILSEDSDAGTVIHEAFHLQLQLDKNSRNNLILITQNVLKNQSEKKKLEKAIRQNIQVFQGKTLEEIMSSLDTMNKDSLTVDQEEIFVDLHTVYQKRNSGKYLPRAIIDIFNRLASSFRRIYENATGRALLPSSMEKAYSRFYTNNNSSLNQDAKSNNNLITIANQKFTKEEFFDKYTDKSLYIKDGDNDVYIYNSRYEISNKNKNEGTKLNRELLSARAFSKNFNSEVFLLPEQIDKSFIAVTKGKNPDAISNKHFVEFKQIENGAKRSFEQRLREGSKQVNGDIVYIDSAKKPTEGTYGGFINSVINTSSNPERYNGMKVVVSTDFKDFKIFEIKEKRVEQVNSLWQTGTTMHSPSNQSVSQDISSVNDKEILYQKLMDSDSIKGLNKRLKDYTSDEVQTLIENNIYVPDSIINQMSDSDRVSNPVIKEEKAIRSLISRFVSESDKETANLSPNLRSFIEKMKAEKETDWNENMEKMYTKFYLYSKVLTPSEMRKQFINEHQTLPQLLSLKRAVTKRRIYVKDSKTGKYHSRVYVPKTGYVYSMISGLNENSSEAEINDIIASIKKDTDVWIKAYLRATRDYEKVNAVNTGSEKWLNLTAEIGYLAFGDLDFAFAEKLRLASVSGERELGQENRKLNDELYSQEYADSLGDYIDAELKDLAEKHNKKLEETVEWERFKSDYNEYVLKDKYENIISELKQQYKEDLKELRSKLKEKFEKEKQDLKERYDYKVFLEKYNRFISEEELKKLYKHRLFMLRSRYEMREKINKVERQLKKSLNVNLADYDFSLIETTSYIYDLMHNHKKKSNYSISNEDYESLKTQHGTVDKEEGVVTFYDVYEDDDGNAVIEDMDMNLGEEKFDRKNIPSDLESKLSDIAIEDIKDTSLTWERIPVDTKMEISDALLLIREEAKQKMDKKKSDIYQRRNVASKETISNILKGDVELSDEMLEKIANEKGLDFKKLKSNPDKKAELEKFKSEAERYFRRNRGFADKKEISKFRKALYNFAQGYGQFQRFARFLGKDIEKHFVLEPQKALDEKARNISRRNKEFDKESDKILSDGSPANDKGKFKQSQEKKEWFNSKHEIISERGANQNLTGWNLAATYMFSKNIHGFIKLVSPNGNNISIEEMAKINPISTFEYINEDLKQRQEFRTREEERRVYANTRGIDFKSHTLSSILSPFNEERLLKIKKDLENNKKSNLPSYAVELADSIIKLLGKETSRLEKAAYDNYNAPFKLQKDYVPLYSRDSGHRDSVVGGKEQPHNRVYKGMIKDRTMERNYALMLEPITVYRNAVRDQENMINMTSIVNDLNYLMSDKGGNLHQIIVDHYGNSIANIFEKQIEVLSDSTKPMIGFESLANKIVSNASVSAIAFNMLSIPRNFASFIISMSEGELKPKYLSRAFAEYNSDRKTWTDRYRNLAPDIANSTFSFDYQMLKDSNSLNRFGTAKEKVMNIGTKGIEWADQYTKKITFIASYLQSIDEGMREQDAAVKATQLIKRTQSVSNPDSLSILQRDTNNPYIRALFAFTKDTFQIWNMITLGVANDFQNKKYKNIFYKFAGVVLTAGALALLKGGWLPDEDDDEFKFGWREFLRDMVSQSSESFVPYFGPLIKQGFDGWDSELISFPTEIGKLIAMPMNKKDYTFEEYLNQIGDVLLAISATAGNPVTAEKRVFKTLFPNGIEEGVQIPDVGYLINNAVGNVEWLDLLGL